MYYAQLEAEDYFPPHSKIMQSPLMLPLLWCRQSQPGVYTSTEKPCGSEGNVMQVTEGLYVFNVRISLYERIALYTDNFICKHISSCVKRTQVFLCSQAWACRGKVRKLNIYNIFILFSHFSCCEGSRWLADMALSVLSLTDIFVPAKLWHSQVFRDQPWVVRGNTNSLNLGQRSFNPLFSTSTVSQSQKTDQWAFTVFVLHLLFCFILLDGKHNHYHLQQWVSLSLFWYNLYKIKTQQHWLHMKKTMRTK